MLFRSVVSWASIGEAEKTNRQVASTAGANNLCLVNTIEIISLTGYLLTRSLNARLSQAIYDESSLLAPARLTFADDII